MKLFAAPRAQPISLLAAAALLAVAAILAGACGYPTFSFEPAGTTTSTTTSATGTGTGGGTPASTTGTGGEPATSSVSATSSGTGGEPACTIAHTGKKGTCEYLPKKECGCTSAGEKCAVEDQVTGESNCIPVSMTAKPKWSGCQTDSDCARGTWCDHQNRVCKPICTTVDDCELNQQCIPVFQDKTTTAIPGLRVCTSHCDPIQPEPPCSLGLTCIYNFVVKDFECATSGGVPEASSCTNSASCELGLICVGAAPNYTCERWCSPADGLKSSGCPAVSPKCEAFSPNVIRDGVSYGACAP
jgi:hypothetical protein